MTSSSDDPQEDVDPAADPVDSTSESVVTGTFDGHTIPWRLLFPIPLPPHENQTFTTWPATWPPVVRKNNE